ncbi:hypothetical protein SAMN04489745_1623 [Arthrobacter woluwensis]|uniref:Uncharacterized protein n=1 Tax=Arthrobacter woluwensis TaxID=156980 RepID=A0A1H4NDP3_9MICC|nr:hypothetical protein SAMN04489745_1623 [Arthrobacter woluwensis]
MSPEATALLQHSLAAQGGTTASGAQGVVGADVASSAAHRSVVVDPTAIPVFALNPDFVRGASQDAGKLWYVAFTADQGAAHQTLFTAPDASGAWKPVNVASGDTEQRMAALAKGGELLFEPQIGAWYAVSGHQVRALSHSAVESIGTAPMSLTAYQHKVASSYGDKLPGSTYDRGGAAGGFDAKGSVGVSSLGSAAPEGGAAATSGDQAALAAGGTAAALAGAGVGLVMMRRRSVRS